MSRYIDLDQVEFLKVDGNEEFNHGVDCCVNRLLEAKPIKAVPLDRIKEAEAALDNAYEELDGYDQDALGTFKCRVDEVFSKLIAEVEGKHEKENH